MALPVNGKLDLFISKTKAVLLLQYRNQQIANRQCLCSNVIKYINQNDPNQGHLQDLLNAMDGVCKCHISKKN